MTAQEIRQNFIDFFIAKSHLKVDSAPIVLKDDPSLMFTNAGMNQFKEIFLGHKHPMAARVVDTQKCLRVSGKHNDLEEVGRDTYHHTMFEMLGNWSFGNQSLDEQGYFKKEAILWAWELLTQVYKINPSILYATVFSGDAAEALEKDQESENIWASIIDKNHILSFGKKDNFWEMGGSGPCGPSSEIHIDLRDEKAQKEIPAANLINTGHPLVIELWNLVFIQYNRLENKTLEHLPLKYVDTGMGFERLCMVLQGKISSYDTDIFSPLIHEIELLSKKKYGHNPAVDMAMRVVADHLRAVSFAIADGQIPSNTGAGYVIRRILRRALRYAYSNLNIKEAFLYKLLGVLAGQFENIFPELANQKTFIEKVIKEEEQNFLHTLSKGLQLFNRIADTLKPHDSVPGETIFELYDTYGFPLDLTRLLAEERHLKIDEKGFETAMLKQKERSRKATKIETSDWTILNQITQCTFTGYESLEEDTEILRFRKVKQNKKEIFQVVLSKTPFYAESGGQIGDTGILINAGISYPVIDTKKEHDLIIHFLESFSDHPEKNIKAVVDAEKRTLTANNHTATHLLQAALKTVLGNHIEQKGSWVGPEYLRFDFAHFQKLSLEQIHQVEDIVNQKIWENIAKEELRDIPIAKAKAMGAMALFGEKYGEKVRVIRFDNNFSVELCGGIHVRYTGQIGLFKISGESAIAAGIRRIEAITAKTAYRYFRNQETLNRKIGLMVKNEVNVIKGVERLLSENIKLNEQNARMQQKLLASLKSKLEQEANLEADIFICIQQVEIPGSDALKNLVFELLRNHKTAFILLVAVINEKVILNLGISDMLTKERGWHAGNLMREWAKNVRGGGGGQASFANAGGSYLAGIETVIKNAKDWINQQIND